jgi:hypothetical protein
MVELGLELVADNPNLTFIFFVSLALLAVLGLRFAYYASRNRDRTGIQTAFPIWSHLLSIGILATLYGVAGILEIVTSVEMPYKSALMLATTLLLAFAIRRIHDTATGTDGDSKRSNRIRRVVRAGFVGIVLVQGVLLFALGFSDVTATVGGVSALSFLVYGLVFYREETTANRLRGTMLDSLLRHLLPVLTFAALVVSVDLAVTTGLDRIIVLHVQVVFIIMTATALMTATIKLRQNLASL